MILISIKLMNFSSVAVIAYFYLYFVILLPNIGTGPISSLENHNLRSAQKPFFPECQTWSSSAGAFSSSEKSVDMQVWLLVLYLYLFNTSHPCWL